MSISSQLPPAPLASASPTLFALAAAGGGSIDARVLGQQATGLTQVQIGRQLFDLQLPMLFPAGTMLTLNAQQIDGQTRLALVSSIPPVATGAAPASTAPVAAPSTAQPAAFVQLSPAALAEPVALQTMAQPVERGSTVPLARPASVPTGTGPGVSIPVTPSATPDISITSAAPVLSAASPGAGTPPVVAASPPPMPAAGGPVAPTPALPLQTETADPAVQPASTPAAREAAGPAMLRHAIPYNAAPPAAGVTVPTRANAAPAPAVDAPIGVVLPSNAVGQRAPAASPSTLPGAVQAPPAAPQAQTPQAALSQMVQASLPRQDSVVGLTKVLTGVVGSVALPEPVLKAAKQVLARQLPLDAGKLGGTTLERALQRSGIFQEALVAGGKAPIASGDLKTALLGLRNTLVSWLGDGAPVEKVSPLPPPLRGVPPRAKMPTAAGGEVPADPREAGKVMLERTEAALSRLRLHQAASLPDTASQRPEGQWSLDLPVMIGGQPNALHLQIHHDAEGGGRSAEERGWQVRFAIHLGEAGEVGAQLSLRGQSAGVMLWAEDDTTSRALEENLDAVRQGLSTLGLIPGAIIVRHGAPHAAVLPPTHYVDETR